MVNGVASSSTSLNSEDDSSGMKPPAKFPEENLLLSKGDGAGYLPARPGMLLKNGRYEVIRKLSYGMSSSTWLVFDAQ